MATPLSVAGERYTPGHTANASAFMARRSAASHAAFFLPYLRPGMVLLDCGCGPGTITLGLAKVVARGRVVGVDVGQSQVALAQERARAGGVSNAVFQVASVYALPFRDGTFGAAFAHALLEHLRDPVGALREVGRTLRPGAALGVRSPDWGGFLVWPAPPEMKSALERYTDLQRRNGGEPNRGRQLAALLRQAGFARVQMSAAYEIYDDPREIAEYLALQLERDDVQDGTALAAAMRAWSANPEAFFAQAWVAAVGWREE